MRGQIHCWKLELDPLTIQAGFLGDFYAGGSDGFLGDFDDVGSFIDGDNQWWADCNGNVGDDDGDDGGGDVDGDGGGDAGDGER